VKFRLQDKIKQDFGHLRAIFDNIHKYFEFSFFRFESHFLLRDLKDILFSFLIVCRVYCHLKWIGFLTQVLKETLTDFLQVEVWICTLIFSFILNHKRNVRIDLLMCCESYEDWMTYWNLFDCFFLKKLHSMEVWLWLLWIVMHWRVLWMDRGTFLSMQPKSMASSRMCLITLATISKWNSVIPIQMLLWSFKVREH
jgi:hypothetical protein